MSYEYNDRYSPPAPVLRVTVRSPSDSTKQVTTDALVDTGADITCLPIAIMKAVGGEPASTYAVHGINDTFVGTADSYFVEFEVALIKKLTEALAIGDEFILGRNLLNEFRFWLDGPERKLKIS